MTTVLFLSNLDAKVGVETVITSLASMKFFIDSETLFTYSYDGLFSSTSNKSSSVS